MTAEARRPGVTTPGPEQKPASTEDSLAKRKSDGKPAPDAEPVRAVRTVDDDEERCLRADENNLENILHQEPRLQRIAAAANLTADDLRNPKNVAAFERAAARAEQSTDGTALAGGLVERVRILSARLVAAAPFRPPWNEAPTPAPSSGGAEHVPIEPTSKARKPKAPQPKPKPKPKRNGPNGQHRRTPSATRIYKPKKGSRPKGFLGKRQSLRGTDLLVLLKYRNPKIRLRDIADRFPGRDAGDPEEVSQDEISAAGIKLMTEAEMFAIEDEASAEGRKTKNGKEYRFSFKTISCYDVPADEVRRHRNQRNNERGAKKKRTARMEKARSNPTPDPRLPPPADGSYEAWKAANAAKIEAQEQSLLNAVALGGSTVRDLIERIADDPSWDRLAAGNRESFRRIVARRLDQLKRDRAIDDCYDGARGGRLVFRVA